MIFRSLLSGLTFLGFVACAGADTEDGTSPDFTYADVEAAPGDWRAVDPANLVIFNTSKGEILIELLPDVAPEHADQFRAYVQSALYDGTEFHRVIQGFMAQGGDVAATHGQDKMLPPMDGQFVFRRTPADMPLDTIGPADSATGGYYNGFPIETQAQFLAEMSRDGQVESWIPHCPGVLSTARTDDPNSGNAQFFLISDGGQHLDKQYTAKGRVLVGLDVVKKIKLGPRPNGFPIPNPDVLLSATLAADLPEADRPEVFVQKTSVQSWADRLVAADRLGNRVCDLPPVPAVVK
ncbi:MAG: peptidylprolyl isomerase [Henriciella sp.]|nr:peptidylprolyl isomerase [Henriciella sp.]